MKAERRIVNGTPEILINGQVASRMLGRPVFPGWLAPEKIHQFLDTGVKIYFLELEGPHTGCWDGLGGYDFHQYDRLLERIAGLSQDLLLIPFIGSRGGAPYHWARDNQDQLARLNTGQPLFLPSMASQSWREFYFESLGHIVRHFENGPLSERIVGYNVLWNCNEWFGYDLTGGSLDAPFADYSEPMRAHFRRWLRARYENDVSRLRHLWKDPKVSFETAELPDVDRRTARSYDGFFTCDSPWGQQVADYYRCIDETNARNAVGACRAVKQALRNPKLAGLMFGYSYCGHKRGFPHEFGHGAARIAMQSEDIDFLHVPYSYFNRDFGTGCHYSQCAAESALLHGKVFIDQTDTNSHVTPSRDAVGGTVWESVQCLIRDGAYPLTKNCHCYYMEAGPGTFNSAVEGGTRIWTPLWYDFPEMKEAMAAVKRAVDRNQREGSESVTDVALIVSNHGHYYRRIERVFGNLFIEVFRNWIIQEAGTPFDDYMLEDFDLIPRPYKVYIFLNPHYVSSALRSAIRARLNREGATAIWFYAPGYVDETGSDPAHLRELTGINIAVDHTRRDFLHVDLRDSGHPYLDGIGALKDYGSDCDPSFYQKGCGHWSFPSDKEDFRFKPVCYVEDDEAEALGVLRGAGKTGLAVKKTDAATSIYSVAPLLPVEILRNILETSGVHLYSRAGDLIYANSRTVGVTYRAEGAREIQLPRPCTVYDALSGELLAENTRLLRVEARYGESRIYRLDGA